MTKIKINEDDISSASSVGQQYRILSLSGGGYRGLYTASVLAYIEDYTKKPLRESFDLICGTSIGGIIATGLACGIPASEIRDKIKAHGSKIFPQRMSKHFKKFGSAMYDSLPLEDAIKDVLTIENNGVKETHADKLLTSIDMPLLLTGVNATSEEHVLFCSTGLNPKQAELDNYTVLQAALSTSAAPTYFPAHMINGNAMVDGGLIANAPDLVAVTEVIRTTRRKLADLYMLSIGTASPTTGKASKTSMDRGLLGWGWAGRIIKLTLNSQELLAVEQTKALLGNRYLRIDYSATKDQGDQTELDQANEDATNTLLSLAKMSYEELMRSKRNLLDSVIHTHTKP